MEAPEHNCSTEKLDRAYRRRFREAPGCIGTAAAPKPRESSKTAEQVWSCGRSATHLKRSQEPGLGTIRGVLSEETSTNDGFWRDRICL
jgi:hypothetical protein